jgi:hypothetical protein
MLKSFNALGKKSLSYSASPSFIEAIISSSSEKWILEVVLLILGIGSSH